MNRAAQQLGRLGGKKTSEAKTAAARANGKLGGRPKKTPKAKKSQPSGRCGADDQAHGTAGGGNQPETP